MNRNIVIPAEAGIQNRINSDMDPRLHGDDKLWQKNIIRDLILPEIEKEINTGKNFATLRQIFHAFILAAWYKKNLKQALLNQVYANKNKIAGISLPLVGRVREGVEHIYQQYLQAYKKGVFNFISAGGGSASGGKEEPDATGQTIPRKYFSGGTVLKSAAMTTVTTRNNLDHAEIAALKKVDYAVTVDMAMFNPAMPVNLDKLFPEDKGKVLRIWERQEEPVWGQNVTINTFVHLLELSQSQGKALQQKGTPQWNVLDKKMGDIEVAAIVNGAKATGMFDGQDLETFRSLVIKSDFKGTADFKETADFFAAIVQNEERSRKFEAFWVYMVKIIVSLETYGFRMNKRYSLDVSNVFSAHIFHLIQVDDLSNKPRLRNVFFEGSNARRLNQHVSMFWWSIDHGNLEHAVYLYRTMPHEFPSYVNDLRAQITALSQTNTILADLLKNPDINTLEQSITKPKPLAGRLELFNVDRIFEYDLKKDTATSINPAMTQDQKLPGGIKLNQNDLKMNVARHGAPVQFAIDPAMSAQFESGNFTGIEPIIRKITPIQGLPVQYRDSATSRTL